MLNSCSMGARAGAMAALESAAVRLTSQATDEDLLAQRVVTRHGSG